jgi:hypothetical protein
VILAAESSILNDEFLILNDESSILNDEVLILDDESSILNDEFLILNDEARLKTYDLPTPDDHFWCWRSSYTSDELNRVW